MYSLISDFRFAFRQLRKSMGFTLTTVFMLTLGIAVTTIVFSLVDAVLLRPLPFPHSERIFSLDTLGRPAGTSGGATMRQGTSYPNFFDWRDQSRSFTSMASYTAGGLILGSDNNGPARRVPGIQVSSGFFETLGVLPELGRGFTRADEQPGSHVVVLSHDTWQTVFAGAKDVLGKSLVLSDVTYTVIGVMPRGFYYPVESADAAFWISMAMDGEGKTPSTQQRGYNQLHVIGRLRSGVTIQQAKDEMDTIQRGLAARYPDSDQNEIAVNVVPELQDLTASVQNPLRILFAAVCCLLLIVCANVAGLMLTRTSKRRGELAIRVALGATRVQILRQLLIESLTLSLCGGIAGLVVTVAALRIAPTLLPANLPRVEQVSLSGTVLAFALVVSALTGILFGLLPAWRASKQDPSRALAENGRRGTGGRSQYRLHSALIIFETALGLVLLVGAGLLIRSFDRILNVDPGFSPRQMLTFRISVPVKRYTDDQKTSLFRQLLPRLKGLPGVQSVTAAFPLPLTEGDIHISFSIAGRPVQPGDEPSARVSLIEPEFFETMKIPLQRGRFFRSTEHDVKGVPVVIVNDAFARKFFPGEDALGQHLRSGLGSGDPPPMREIVGIVGNVKRGGLTESFAPEYYIPYEQAPVATPSIAMRLSGDPLSYSKSVQTELSKLDSTLPIYHLNSYDDDLQRSTAQQRFQTLLLTAFAAIALLLAGIGLYALLSYIVSQRTKELGLRIALGAPRGSVLGLMLFRGLRLSAIGLIVGLVAAAALTRSIAGLLYGVKPLDAATFGVMAFLLLAVSCAAALVPAYRASMVDPNETLRDQ